ncbi:hypothetical protein GH714_029209 [Hevea brasiliensis]|uniref:TPX2 C-terminal domain-containing protein n=1 Tax=Hevea brasiliensis TaxID=3981 RepID=A0A6A6KXF5_HEVBR|nr:hypothetical protein GH714_029209 [Hevea brasiliensis]
MGEPTCLMRSFSHPSNASREAKEGDPLRALTESISFGRFMSESLAWEKWSTFSHNRYLEEVEQFSKPGSVAQKRAYFEAHYKKRAAMKAAALLEQANAEVLMHLKNQQSSVRMLKESSTATQNPTRKSISKLLPSINLQSEDRRFYSYRTRSLFNKSVSGGAIASGILQALSGDRAKSSTASGSKARSPIISSPFSFRSEERAAKLLLICCFHLLCQFFQKLEEKNNAKEAEKTHLQVKSKIPLTRPRSPKLGRKPSSNMVQETNFQVPRRPSVNAESSKRITKG